MFFFIEKIIDKLNMNFNFLNRTNSPSCKRKIYQNISGDFVAGDKIIKINPRPAPVILQKRPRGVNSFNEGYKTQLILTIGFPPEKEFLININNIDASIIDKPILQSTSTMTTPRGTFPCKSYLIFVFTKQKLSISDFSFSISELQ